MKTNKTVFISTLIWLALLVGLLAGCKGEGPMGPEGEQGPDGTGGGSGGGALVYVTPDDAAIKWEVLDGWSGYGIGMLNVNDWIDYNGESGIPLADEAASAINQGGLVLVYADFGAGWRQLPLTDIPMENSQFAVYLNYELVNGQLIIWSRASGSLGNTFDENYSVRRVKVVVAAATESNELTTNQLP